MKCAVVVYILCTPFILKIILKFYKNMHASTELQGRCTRVHVYGNFIISDAPYLKPMEISLTFSSNEMQMYVEM